MWSSGRVGGGLAGVHWARRLKSPAVTGHEEHRLWRQRWYSVDVAADFSRIFGEVTHRGPPAVRPAGWTQAGVVVAAGRA